MPKVTKTSKNRTTRTTATAGPAIATGTRASQRLAGKNGKNDTTATIANDPANTVSSGNIQAPSTGGSRAKPAAKQTRARAKRNKGPQAVGNDASNTTTNDAVEESSPDLNCHPVRNPPESPIKIAKASTAAAQPKEKKQARTKAKATTDVKPPAVEVAAKVKATKKSVKAKTTVAAPPAASNNNDPKKERELRAQRRAAAKAATHPTATTDDAPSDSGMETAPNHNSDNDTAQADVESAADAKTEEPIVGDDDERAQPTTEPTVQTAIEEKLEQKVETRDEVKDESGPTDGDRTDDEQNERGAEEIEQGGELDVEALDSQPQGEEPEAPQEEDMAEGAMQSQSEEAGVDVKDGQVDEPEVEAKQIHNEEPEDQVEQPSNEESVAEVEQPQPEVEQEPKIEDTKVNEEKQLAEQVVEEQELVIKASQDIVVEEEQQLAADGEHELAVEKEQDAVVEEKHQSKEEGEEEEEEEEDTNKEYSLNPLKRRRMYDDSDEEDLYEEEEVLRLSAYIATSDTDDEAEDNSGDADAGEVAQGESEIPQSISAFGHRKKKTVYKKRKLSHENESESASSDEETPVESASRVEANQKITNESDRDQSSVVVNAPLSRFDSAEVEAEEVLSGLLAVDASDDEDEDNHDLETPHSPTAPSTSRGAMQGSPVTRPATPEPGPSGSTATTTSSSSSSGSSIVYIGRRPPTEDTNMRVIIRNIPRPTVEPVDVPKMPSYTVLQIPPKQPPPSAGFYRCR